MRAKVKPDTIVRTIILALALVNQFLVMFGKSPLPIEDASIEMLVSTAWTIASAVWSWWKNNSITQPALIADEFKDDLKRGRLA